MDSKFTTPFLFALVAVLFGVLLTSRVFGLELIPASEPLNLLLLDKQNCSSQLAAVAAQEISAQAGGKYWDCLNRIHVSGFPLDANSSVGMVADNYSDVSTNQHSAASVGRADLLLHLMITISMVVLMFSTQIMEWELLHLHRTLDSSS